MKRSAGTSRPRVWRALAAGALVAILALTLRPNPQAAAAALQTPLLCLVCGERGGTDVILNLLLFMPFAVALRLSGMSWGRTVLACAGISLLVESLQFTIIAGRDASLSDLVTNTLGGAVGAMIAAPVGRAIVPDGDHATRLTVGAAVAWLGMLALSAWLMGPWTPAGSRVSSHWAASSEWSNKAFPGTVTAVQSAGFPLPPGPVSDSLARRLLLRLRQGRIELRVDLISGRLTAQNSRWIYFLRIGSAYAPRLSQDGGDLLLEVPVRALHFRFSAPTLRLRDGMPVAPGIPVTITISEVKGFLSMVSSYRGRTFTLSVGPTQGWSLVDPFGLRLGPDVRLLTGVWLGAWLVPLGYWGAWSRHRGAVLLLSIGTVVLGLWLLPALAGFPSVHSSEWFAAGAGLAVGRALAALAAYLASRCGSPSGSESFSS